MGRTITVCCNSIDDSIKAYNNYIEKHKTFVVDAWHDIQIKFYNHPYVTDRYINLYITDLINKHDNSKYVDEEFEPYRKFFYTTEEDIEYGVNNIQKDYDDAWIHHYSNNPHHWEYWVEQDKTQEREYLQFIRDCYSVERICDWMAMSRQNNNNVVDWYNKHKDIIYLSNEDRKFMENIIYNMEE